jgi:hypothetical protein
VHRGGVPVKPVIAVPGLTPTSPVTALPPVQVTVVAPRIPKLSADPSVDADWADARDGPRRNAANPMLANRIKYLHFILNLPFPSYGNPSNLVTTVERCKRDAGRFLPKLGTPEFRAGDDYTTN